MRVQYLFVHVVRIIDRMCTCLNVGDLCPRGSFVRALALLDLSRLSRYHFRRRERFYANDWSTACLAACGVINACVLRLQLCAAYMHVHVLQQRSALLTSSAGVAIDTTRAGSVLREHNSTSNLQWAAVEGMST
jgi:hypothetical protein